MLLRLSPLLLALFAAPHGALAQAVGTSPTAVAPAASPEPEEWAPHTGDAWLDTWLIDLNVYAARYRGAFADELVRYQGAPRPWLESVLAAGEWQPADLYVACAAARALGRTCREVAAQWRRDHAGGWPAVLDRLDPDRGPEALARVRQGLVGSFDRWARPIELDAALRRAFPGREP